MEKRIAIEREGDGSNYFGNEDRLSQLPQHTLHHILSLLSQEEAVQTSLLSKSWRHHWYGIPKVEFCEREFTKKGKTFVSVVENTLQGYLDQKLPLKELCLKISEDESLFRLLEKWIPVIMLRSLGVQALALCFLSTLEYEMPFSVFSESESLEKLYLKGYNLISSTIADKVLIKHLQVLILKRVYITDETFEKIMSSCPSIECVRLLDCEGFKTIKLINNKHLKFFHLIDHQKDDDDDDDDYCRIDFDAPNIERIKIVGCSNLFYHHNNFPHLKSLVLKNVKLSTNSLDIFSSNFPCLAELELADTYGYEQFRLSSRSVRSLTIWCLLKSIKVINIDAPNILYFSFACIFLPSSFSFATTSAGHDWKSCISVDLISDHASSSWLTNLNKLLKSVSQSHISLDLLYNPLLDISYGDGYTVERVITVEHLILTQDLSSNSIPDSFLNFVFRIFRPRYTYTVDSEHENVDLEKSLWERLERGSRKMSDQNNFWQRDLEQANIEASEDNGKQWYPVLGLPECALSTGQKIRFRLTWRES